MTITCTVCVPPMIFVVDPPVLGSDKVPNLYSFKKNTLGFQTQDFQSCILSKGWMLKMHLVPSGICVGNLLQPLQELLGTTRRGGGWLGDLAFFVFLGRLARLFVGHICFLIDYLWKHLITASCQVVVVVVFCFVVMVVGGLGGGGLLLLFCYFPLAKYRFFWLFSCLTRKTVPSSHRVPADAS